MPKKRGRNNHSRMIAALVNLEVGTAGERNLNLDLGLSVFGRQLDLDAGLGRDGAGGSLRMGGSARKN